MSTPDTFAYMIAGYIVLFGFLISYVIILWIRFRKLRNEETSLEERVD